MSIYSYYQEMEVVCSCYKFDVIFFMALPTLVVVGPRAADSTWFCYVEAEAQSLQTREFFDSLIHFGGVFF